MAPLLATLLLFSAKLPPAGLFVPGQSLGGLRLGMTAAEVKAVWGTDFGRCRNCAHATWYYNYAPFTPKGAGVEFRRARVAAVFTLRAPAAWHTPKRLRIGDPVEKVTRLYGTMPQVTCGAYAALTMPYPATSTFYVREGKVWGFGLSRVAVPVCR